MLCIAAPLKGRGGFSLIEMLAAMALLCIGLLALCSCFGTTVISNVYAAERGDAVRVAQEQMEAAKGMCFENMISRTEQIDRNGVNFTCCIIVKERQTNPYLKDINIIVRWIPRRASGGAAEQVQLATVVLGK
jgi:prepilin-type N-terminal cleavage/methylation domain-containing protein